MNLTSKFNFLYFMNLIGSKIKNNSCCCSDKFVAIIEVDKTKKKAPEPKVEEPEDPDLPF